MPLLHNGDRFPRLSIRKVGGGTIELPNDLGGSFGVVLIYRGAWCPYCNAQLAANFFDELTVLLFPHREELSAPGFVLRHNQAKNTFPLFIKQEACQEKLRFRKWAFLCVILLR